MKVDHSELLCFRRVNRIDEICEFVPKPLGSVPKNGLHVWDDLQLDYKLPVVKGPKGPLVFSRAKVGKKLWLDSETSEKPDFNLADPYCYDVSYTYEPLHDENLCNYFQAPSTRKRLIELGVISKTGDALCSIKQFNEYRRYLRRLHVDAVKKELKRREEYNDEKRQLDKLRQQEMRDLASAAAQHAKIEKKNALREELKRKKEAERERILTATRLAEERVLLVAAKKRLENLARIERGRQMNLRIRQRNDMAAEIERQRKISTLRQWRDRDIYTNKCAAYEQREAQALKEFQEAQKWDQRLQEQLQHASRKCELLQHLAQEAAENIHERGLFYRNEHNRMDGLLRKIKVQGIVQANLDRKARIKKRAMMAALWKAWEEKYLTPKDEKTIKVLEKSLDSTLALFRNKSEGQDILKMMDRTKKGMDTEMALPPEVSEVLDKILDDVIRIHVRKNVAAVIMDVSNKIMEKCEEHRHAHNKKPYDKRKKAAKQSEETADPLRSSSYLMKQWSNTDYNKIPSDFKIQSKVSFVGPDKCIGQADQVDGPLKSVKERPPTPVPSLTDLPKAVFKETLPNKSLKEKEKLGKLFRTLTKYLVRHVGMKIEDCRDPAKRRMMQKQLHHIDLPVSKMIDMVTRVILEVDSKEVVKQDEIQILIKILTKHHLHFAHTQAAHDREAS